MRRMDEGSESTFCVIFFCFFQKIFVVLLDSQRKLFIKENDGQQCTEEVKAEFDAAWALIVKGNGLYFEFKKNCLL